jgi:hypothetical protein
MKARATTLMIGIGMTFALLAPGAQATVQWGDGAAATPPTPTLHRTTNHKGIIATGSARRFQVLRNTF